MADRVSATITIGGISLPSLVDALVETINAEGLSLEWDGGAITPADLAIGKPMTLYANEVAWGAFNMLEDFCRKHGLAYRRWYGSYSGSWGSGRSVYRGANTTTCRDVDTSSCRPVVTEYATSDDDEVMIDAEAAQRLGSYEAILAYFAEADFEVPPLTIVDPTPSPRTAATACPT